MRCAVLFSILLGLASPPALAAAPATFTRLGVVDFSIKTNLKPAGLKECALLTTVAEALSRAQQAAKLVENSIKVLDCYHPFSSTPKLTEERRKELARGGVVDVILADPTGGPVALPQPHDHAIMLSARQYKKVEAKKNVKKLADLLAKEGFAQDSKVWYRFQWTKAAQAEIQDFSPDELPKR